MLVPNPNELHRRHFRHNDINPIDTTSHPVLPDHRPSYYRFY